MELKSKLYAIDKALAAWGTSPNGRSGMEAAIRTFCDARGLVMVPKKPTLEMAVAARLDHEGEAYLPYSLYASMIAASPDPFGDAE